MPARPRTALAVAALAALGGLVAGCSGQSSGLAASTASATSSAATAPAAVPGAPSRGSAAAPAPAGRTSAAGAPASGASTAPPATSAAQWVADPWNKGYEFGFVWGARRSGDAVALTFDPAGMLLGAQAKAYYDAHPDEERFDYKIVNDKSFTQTLRVPATATLYGNQVLGPRNGSQNQSIAADRLLARAAGDDTHKVAVWLKRTGSGPVAYLAEQYLP